MERSGSVVMDSLAALAAGPLVTRVCCMRCGGTGVTLRRVDRPVEGYVCKLCLAVTRSAVVKSGKEAVMVGPLAEEIAKIGVEDD